MIVFIDTNILISGTFFSGPEAELLNHSRPDFVTADICQKELIGVCEEKFSEFGAKTKEVALKEAKDALLDIDIIPFKEYSSELDEAKKSVKGENDRKVLAAALKVDPDYFISGDKHFHTEQVRRRLKVISTSEILKKLESPTNPN